MVVLAFKRDELVLYYQPRCDIATGRIVGAEVKNCKLSTLASSFNFPHQPSHRAINDVLATGDLLHLLIERAAGFGIFDLDEFAATMH